MTDIHKCMLERMAKLELDVEEQRYIVLLDVYSVHREKAMLDWWKQTGMGRQGLLIFVPANYTGQLQPLDISFNGPFKAVVRRSMMSWLSQVIALQISGGAQPHTINLKQELQLSNLKEPFCAALDEALRLFGGSVGRRHILRGFKEAGVLACFEDDKIEQLAEQARAKLEEGALFPGGKNTQIDALLDYLLVLVHVYAPPAARCDACVDF